MFLYSLTTEKCVHYVRCILFALSLRTNIRISMKNRMLGLARGNLTSSVGLWVCFIFWQLLLCAEKQQPRANYESWESR